jgi:hypothetical protein
MYVFGFKTLDIYMLIFSIRLISRLLPVNTLSNPPGLPARVSVRSAAPFVRRSTTATRPRAMAVPLKSASQMRRAAPALPRSARSRPERRIPRRPSTVTSRATSLPVARMLSPSRRMMRTKTMEVSWALATMGSRLRVNVGHTDLYPHPRSLMLTMGRTP